MQGRNRVGVRDCRSGGRGQPGDAVRLLEEGRPRGMNSPHCPHATKATMGDMQENEAESPAALSESSEESKAKDGQSMIFPQRV